MQHVAEAAHGKQAGQQRAVVDVAVDRVDASRDQPCLRRMNLIVIIAGNRCQTYLLMLSERR